MIYKTTTPFHELITVDEHFAMHLWSLPSYRSVRRTPIGEAYVSTVFLGFDHGFGGVPLWYETIIFSGAESDIIQRYSSYDESLEGHRKAVLQVVHDQTGC